MASLIFRLFTKKKDGLTLSIQLTQKKPRIFSFPGCTLVKNKSSEKKLGDKKMNLLQELEGKRGETLTSAMLQYLLLQSRPFRNLFLNLISKHLPIGPITSSYSFSCPREVAGKSDLHTEDPSTEINKNGSPVISKGFLDLLIITDHAAIGIENKINACWQTGQPEKYADILKEYTDHEKILLIILPKSRENEAKKRLIVANKKLEKSDSSNIITGILTWDEILLEGDKCDWHLDIRANEFLFSELKDYLNELISFAPGFDIWRKQLVTKFSKQGNKRQWYFNDQLRRFVNWDAVQSSRSRGATDWAGVQLNGRSNNCWYGFVNDSIVTGKNSQTGNSLFIIQTTFLLQEHKLLTKCSIDSWKNDEHVYSIDLSDDSWGKAETWREFFAPINDAMGAEHDLNMQA
jgi:hypothetical protein